MRECCFKIEMGNDTSLPLQQETMTITSHVTSASDVYDEANEPSVLLSTIEECFVYNKIPPRPSAAGWRAQDWPGGLDNPWKIGTLRITGRASELFLCVWLKNAGDKTKVAPGAALDATTLPAAQGHLLLLQCRVPLFDERGLTFWLEAVLDSSRYFVLRLEKGAAVQLVGLGFRERNAAFELKDSIHNYVSQIKRQSRDNVLNEMNYGENFQASGQVSGSQASGQVSGSQVSGSQVSGSQASGFQASSSQANSSQGKGLQIETISSSTSTSPIARSLAALPRAPLLRPPGEKGAVLLKAEERGPGLKTEKNEKEVEVDEFGDFESATE